MTSQFSRWYEDTPEQEEANKTLFRSYAQTQYYWYIKNGQRERLIEENFAQCAEVCGVPVADFMKELEEWVKTQEVEDWGGVRSDKSIEDQEEELDVFSFSK